jgi:hypothetical protein
LFNFKISGIAGGAALILSLLVGLISGAGFLIVCLRALLFGAAFFALFCLVFWLLGQFVPELLSGSGADLDFGAPGSRVNLTVGGSIEGAFPSGGVEEVDNIEKAAGRPRPQPGASGAQVMGLDQGDQSGYTSGGDGMRPANSGSEGGGISLSGGEDSGMMPEFDALSGSFVTTSGAEAEPENFDTPSEPRRPLSRGGKSNVMGDFDPKELAQAIRTVLKKEDKG